MNKNDCVNSSNLGDLITSHTKVKQIIKSKMAKDECCRCVKGIKFIWERHGKRE